MQIARLLPLLGVFILLGAGCFGGDAPTDMDGGVWKSTDGGTTWQQTNVVPTAEGIGTLSTSNLFNVTMDPSDNEAVYIGTRQRGALFTYDSGASWQRPRNEALKEGWIYDIEVDPSDVCTVYYAKDGRLYKTEDCSRSFDSEVYVETRADVKIKRIAVDWYSPNTVWMGLSNGDVLKSEDAGGSWKTVLTSGWNVTGVLVSNTDSRQVLVATNRDGFYRTTDGGVNWEHVERDLSSYANANRINRVVQTKDSGVVVAASVYGLMRSTDFGATWEPLNLLTSPGQVDIKALAISPSDGNHLVYFAGSTFYQSHDGGETWDTTKMNTSREPQMMAIDPTNSSVLYVGVAQYEE